MSKRVPLAVVNDNVASSDATHCSSIASPVAAPAVAVGAAKENLCQPCFETPRKEPQVSEPVDYFSATGLFDDDFDESILDEIDTLCELKSAEKSAKQQELDHSCHNEVFSESNIVGEVSLTGSGSSTGSEVIGSGELFSSRVGLDRKEEEQTDSATQSLKNGSMPDEYLKYLQSLNDRQREAACTDISVPLMIVAGPGSGKVLFNLTSLIRPLHVNIFLLL